MTVGVIITVYNLEHYAAEAIRSVLNQTLKPDRVLVINDGSTDSSQQVIKQFENIEVINYEQNRGVLPSVIEGIRLLDTDIIALLDGDDVWTVTKLSEIHTTFQEADTMMVLHNFTRMDATGALLPGIDVTQKNLGRIEQQPIRNQDELIKESILSYRGVWLGSALSFRKSFLDVNSFEHWSMKIWGHELSHQDQPLAAYLIVSNPEKKIRYIPKALFNYRIFGENSSGSSATLVKALKTLQRSKATLLRTHALVKKMEGRVQPLKRQELKLKEVIYLEALYQRKMLNALSLFTTLFLQFWNSPEKAKELVRFFGVFILGPSRFLRLK
jgi:glycosyltransferase involved in cell wall biosynthesis